MECLNPTLEYCHFIVLQSFRAGDKISKPATDYVWFYEMSSDGYSLDDKRNKLEGYGDLQDIIQKYHSRDEASDTDRTAKCFMVPRIDIEAENYDLSAALAIRKKYLKKCSTNSLKLFLERLIQAEVGNVDKKVLNKVQSGILYELLELKGMIV